MPAAAPSATRPSATTMSPTSWGVSAEPSALPTRSAGPAGPGALGVVPGADLLGHVDPDPEHAVDGAGGVAQGLQMTLKKASCGRPDPEGSISTGDSSAA